MEKVLNSNIKIATKLLTENTITAQDLINCSLNKAKQNQNKFNIFITLTENEAKKQSKESTERYKTKKPKSLIDGIPIAIKDNFCTSNIRTTCASKMLENFQSTYNATIYQRLLDCGAILIGKTNLDQFAMGSGTVDSIFGPTRNIWGFKDLDNFYICGGSSGGSAMSVASGLSFA